MKQEIRKMLEELEEELEPMEEELEPMEEEEVDPWSGMTWEEEQAYEEAMKQLVIDGLAGDDMAWSVWSDMWKDLHGCRPRYSEAEIRWMYGLEEA